MMKENRTWIGSIAIGAFLLTLGLASSLAQEQKAEESGAQPKIVYVVKLEGAIFEGLASQTVKKIERIDTDRAHVLILDIDTPGGEVGAVVEVCKAIDKIVLKNVPVYAYISGQAMSGGALISLACDKIYMTSRARLGAAQVKTLSLKGWEVADEKMQSHMRAYFRSYAQNRMYPVALAEAMVDPNTEVKEVFYRGERKFMTPLEIQNTRRELGAAAQDLVESKTVIELGKLAVFTALEAKDYGFCREVYETREALLQGMKLDGFEVEEITMTSEDVVSNFLTNRVVCFFLIALGILGLLVEMWTPGFGVPGILGLTCLALFFVGGYMSQAASPWEILLFVFGAMLLSIEIFVLPGFGVAGISGLICCFAAMLLSLQTFSIPGNEEEMNEFMGNLFTITLGFGVDIMAVFLLSKLFPENAPLQRLSVKTVQTAQEGYTTAIPGLSLLEGQEGRAASSLRPAGKIEIQGTEHDGVTQGDFIAIGQAVRVCEVRGNTLIVEKIVEKIERSS